MKILSKFLTASTLIIFTQGCANVMGTSDKKVNAVVNGPETRNLPIGNSYARTPPKLVRQTVSWGTNKPVQTVAWDNSQWFGPIPGHLMREGLETCKAVGGQRARGYHPKAVGVNGKPIPGGGFLCS